MGYWQKLQAQWSGLSSHLGGEVYLYIKAAVALAAAVVFWIFFKWALRHMQRRAQEGGSLKIKLGYLRFLRRIVGYGLILLIGTYTIELFQLPLAARVFHAALIFLLASPVKELLVIVLQYLENSIASRTRTRVDNIIFEILTRFAGAITYATAAVIALDVLGVNVMPFIAGAGVAGIAIGFAAKDTLSNLIAGILLIIDRPFEVGDRIEVWSAPQGTASWGDVIDIGLRATKIKTTDNIIIIIPNNEIMRRDIVNYTGIDTQIRVRINIGVSYDADIQKAKQIIVGVAESADWISKQPPPQVVVRNFGDSSVDLQARVWIDNARQRMKTISYITDRVKMQFDQAGIEIPYPKRDVHIIRKSK
jgi:small-conductance mechanosensitive channel